MRAIVQVSLTQHTRNGWSATEKYLLNCLCDLSEDLSKYVIKVPVRVVRDITLTIANNIDDLRQITLFMRFTILHGAKVCILG